MKIMKNNGKQFGHWKKKKMTSIDFNDLRLIVHTNDYMYMYIYSNVADKNMIYVVL